VSGIEAPEFANRGDRLVSLAAAIIAVLAALGTLLSHHRSISAITTMNHAILFQARASDRFSAYEAQRVRADVLTALVDADVPRTEAAKKLIVELAAKQQSSASAVLQRALALEEESQTRDERAQTILHSYELLEIATTFFEVSIVLVSISALVRTRIFFIVGCSVSGLGIALMIYALSQGH